MTDRSYTDADVETVACTLWAREWSHPGVSPTVEQVLAEHGPLPMRYYANARAVLDALAAAGWRPPTVAVSVEHSATVAGTGTYRETHNIGGDRD